MRYLLALLLATTGLVAFVPQSAAAAEVKRFEQPELGLAFDYPAQWSLEAAAPRGVLPNELFHVRATESATTSFALAVYQLDAVVTLENIDATFERLDQHVEAWVASQPGGNLVEIYDIVVDNAEGREYGFTFDHNGQKLYANMIFALNGDKAFEVSQWAVESEYEARLATFDQIFATLTLPWSPRV